MSELKHTLEALKIHRPAASARASRTGLYLGLAVAAVAALAAWWWFNRPRPWPVRTVIAQEFRSAGGGNARTLLNASGYVTARRNATVSSKVTGRVVEVLVEEGMKVDEGQVLARLDATNVQANFHLAEAQVDAARRGLGETQAQLNQAERTLRRVTNLVAAKTASAADLDQATADVEALRARLERQRAEIAVAERQLELWKQQVDDTVIRAPFAGVVTSKNAQPGEMISPMSSGGFTRTGICTIVDMASLEVEVDVNESFINRVSPGQPVVVTLDSYPDWAIAAKVIAIIPTADRQKATVRVRVGFEQLDPRILPDMGLKVAFQTNEKSAPVHRSVVVPKRALRRDGERDIVWVAEGGRAEKRPVTVESARADEVTLAGGVAAGEHVVVEGADPLTDGAGVAETLP